MSARRGRCRLKGIGRAPDFLGHITLYAFLYSLKSRVVLCGGLSTGLPRHAQMVPRAQVFVGRIRANMYLIHLRIYGSIALSLSPQASKFVHLPYTSKSLKKPEK